MSWLTPPNTPQQNDSAFDPVGHITRFVPQQPAPTAPSVPLVNDTSNPLTPTALYIRDILTGVCTPPLGIPWMNEYTKYKIRFYFPGTVIPDFATWPGSTPPTEADVEDIWNKYYTVLNLPPPQLAEPSLPQRVQQYLKTLTLQPAITTTGGVSVDTSTSTTSTISTTSTEHSTDDSFNSNMDFDGEDDMFQEYEVDNYDTDDELDEDSDLDESEGV